MEKFDGVVYVIVFVNFKMVLGGKFFEMEWDDVLVVVYIFMYFYVFLMIVFVDIFVEYVLVVGLIFDVIVFWFFYDWMGVVKVGLELVNCYLV